MRAIRRALPGVVLLMSGCGPGGASRGVPASCGAIQPCGGDVVGSWAPDGSCVSQASLQARYMTELGGECPSGTSVSIVDATSDWASISSTFNADGSYSGTTAFSASVEISIPAACLVTRGCSDLDAEFRAMVDPAAGIAAAACQDGGAACACSITQKQTASEAGRYTTAGTVLTTVPAGGGSTDTPYCVQGSQLHLVSLDSSGAAAIASDIVLVRRD
jgi:hypothetical protein